MKLNRSVPSVVTTICLAFSHGAVVLAAECAIPEESKRLDPVEVGFCESDAVFVGKVESRLETTRAFRAEGSEHTQHFRTETSTVRVLTSLKGKQPDKVTMTAELYDKGETFSFALGREYLIFARKLPGENRYAGIGAKCSVQPSLLLVEADNALKQLEQHTTGRKKIDCKNIRTKDAP